MDQIVLLKPLEINPLHKGMAETDVSHEIRREPGFSSLVFGPEHSHMLHIFYNYHYHFQGQGNSLVGSSI